MAALPQMSTVFSFPALPMTRVIAEAAYAWNCRHPEAPINPIRIDWSQLYSIIQSYLRNAYTRHEQLCTDQTRTELQARIRIAAGHAYPWLRRARDPRVMTAGEEETAAKSPP
jgi:hypothetical protein